MNKNADPVTIKITESVVNITVVVELPVGGKGFCWVLVITTGTGVGVLVINTVTGVIKTAVGEGVVVVIAPVGLIL